MDRVEGPALPVGSWWSVDVAPPLDAVVLEFVAFFYEHFDNNDGANHRAAINVDRRYAACAPVIEHLPPVGGPHWRSAAARNAASGLERQTYAEATLTVGGFWL